MHSCYAIATVNINLNNERRITNNQLLEHKMHIIGIIQLLMQKWRNNFGET